MEGSSSRPCIIADDCLTGKGNSVAPSRGFRPCVWPLRRKSEYFKSKDWTVESSSGGRVGAVIDAMDASTLTLVTLIPGAEEYSSTHYPLSPQTWPSCWPNCGMC